VMDAAHDDATGLDYIVMEYVGGGSLSWHLRHGPLPEAKALAIITGIAHALVVAEENRIVHRDIKPDNIMLDLRGTAKLADLGLAKQAIESHTSITLGGSFMGTPAYMSPEQARDAKIADTRDDIYSLGATFYECLTGTPPFQGETPYNIMSELLTKPSPKPRTSHPEISRSADLICRKMMAKTRSLRYADANALLHDLQICQAFGDAGLDRLDASNFDQDSKLVREEAASYGIETSADGVALLPELADDPGTSPARKPLSALSTSRRTDSSVYLAAGLLVALVTIATLALAWVGSHHSLSLAFLKNGPTVVLGDSASSHPRDNTEASPVQPATSIPATDQGSHVATTEKPPIDAPPVVPNEPIVAPLQPSVTPAAIPTVSPANPSDLTNATPPGPLEPTPAIPAVPESAFEARSVAEAGLPPNLSDPTQHPALLKIIGPRDESPEVIPTTWTFYFYDKSAAGHARIISVRNRQIVSHGEDIGDTLTPYKEPDILPEDKLLTDSTQALSIAQGLLPGVTVSSSEFTLIQPRHSVQPMWKVTLWAKQGDDGEHKMGDVTLLAGDGTLITNTLKQ